MLKGRPHGKSWGRIHFNYQKLRGLSTFVLSQARHWPPLELFGTMRVRLALTLLDLIYTFMASKYRMRFQIVLHIFLPSMTIRGTQ